MWASTPTCQKFTTVTRCRNSGNPIYVDINTPKKFRAGNPDRTYCIKASVQRDYRRLDVPESLSESYLWGVMEYFHEDLLKTCDILLVLDDQSGSRLPAHSQVLARCSPVFRGMANEGVLTSTSTSKKVFVPFGDCTREEAISFLSVVYAVRPHEHIYEASALAVARLADKYGVKVYAQYLRSRELCVFLTFCELHVESGDCSHAEHASDVPGCHLFHISAVLILL